MDTSICDPPWDSGNKVNARAYQNDTLNNRECAIRQLNYNVPFVSIARETQSIVSYETMQCWTEPNDTLMSKMAG